MSRRKKIAQTISYLSFTNLSISVILDRNHPVWIPHFTKILEKIIIFTIQILVNIPKFLL